MQYSRLQANSIYQFKCDLNSSLRKFSVPSTSCYIRINIYHVYGRQSVPSASVKQPSIGAKVQHPSKISVSQLTQSCSAVIPMSAVRFDRTIRNRPISAPPSQTGLSLFTSSRSSDAINRLCFYQSSWQDTRRIYSLNKSF